MLPEASRFLHDCTQFFTSFYIACNAVLQTPNGTYTLRNYGRHLNCTISIIFPESFRIIAAKIGSGDCTSSNSNIIETGIMRQVSEHSVNEQSVDNLTKKCKQYVQCFDLLRTFCVYSCLSNR